MGKKHAGKTAAVIAVTAGVVLYILLYFGILITVIPGVFFKIVLGVLPVLFGGIMIGVCIQRIREIRGGEEDDLSQY